MGLASSETELVDVGDLDGGAERRPKKANVRNLAGRRGRLLAHLRLERVAGVRASGRSPLPRTPGLRSKEGVDKLGRCAPVALGSETSSLGRQIAVPQSVAEQGIRVVPPLGLQELGPTRIGTLELIAPRVQPVGQVVGPIERKRALDQRLC